MKNLSLVLMLLCLVALPLFGQEEKMTKDQWQSEMTTAKNSVADLTAKLAALSGDITALQHQNDSLDASVRSCEDALYALLGMTRAEFEAYTKELTDMENRVAELQRMSDAELLTHRDEVQRMSDRLKEMAQSKITRIPRYGDRVKALQDKVAALLQSMSKEKSYTVGTWSRDRDCLWNIAKKKDVYANAWMWPKIWQGNRDKIKDPDVIKPRWVLKIPEGNALTKAEKSAATRYYRSKGRAQAPAESSGGQ